MHPAGSCDPTRKHTTDDNDEAIHMILQNDDSNALSNSFEAVQANRAAMESAMADQGTSVPSIHTIMTRRNIIAGVQKAANDPSG